MYPGMMALKATKSDNIPHTPDLVESVSTETFQNDDKGVNTNIDKYVRRNLNFCANRSILIDILGFIIAGLQKELGDTVVSAGQVEDTNADEPPLVQIEQVGEMVTLKAEVWGSRSQVLNTVTAIKYHVQGRIPFSEITSHRIFEPYPRVNIEMTRID